MKIRITVKFMILVLTAAAAVSSAAFGQEKTGPEGRDSAPFVGSWSVEVVFVPDTLDFTFTESGQYTVTEPSGDIDRFDYTLERERGRIRMQLDEDTYMEWRYSFSGFDEFHLYLIEDDNELIEMLLSGFEDPDDFNSLTEELLSEVRDSVRATVLSHPVLRGVRITD